MLRNCNELIMSSFLEKEHFIPKLTQRQSAKELANSDSTKKTTKNWYKHEETKKVTSNQKKTVRTVKDLKWNQVLPI